MFFGRLVSFLMAFAAGIFAEISTVSDWAFWFMVGAYLVWLAVHRLSKNRFKPLLMMSIVLTLVAIMGVFVAIPIASNYALWIMTAAYLIIVCNTE
jgi:hypothetical protein